MRKSTSSVLSFAISFFSSSQRIYLSAGHSMSERDFTTPLVTKLSRCLRCSFIVLFSGPGLFINSPLLSWPIARDCLFSPFCTIFYKLPLKPFDTLGNFGSTEEMISRCLHRGFLPPDCPLLLLGVFLLHPTWIAV